MPTVESIAGRLADLFRRSPKPSMPLSTLLVEGDGEAILTPSRGGRRRMIAEYGVEPEILRVSLFPGAEMLVEVAADMYYRVEFSEPHLATLLIRSPMAGRTQSLSDFVWTVST